MIDLTAAKQALFTVSIILPRMLAAFAVMPFMGKQILQGLVRNSFAMSLMLVVYPVVAPTVTGDLGSVLVYIAVIAKEVLIGLMIGFLAAIIFWVAENVGFFIDNQRGTTMASIVDPMSGEQTSPLGSMIMQTVTVLFLTSGGFLILLNGLFESYRFWPVLSFFPRFEADFALSFLRQTDRMMRLTALLASPIIIAVFVSELGLGLINRFAPQLNVFFLAMPIKSAVACFILVVYLSFMIHFFEAEYMEINELFGFLKEVLR